MPKEVPVPPPSQKPTAPDNINDIKGFEWWRRTLQYKTGLGLTPEESLRYQKDLAFKKNEKDCLKCNEYRDWMLQYSPTIRFMLDEIKKVDPHKTVGRHNIICDFCEEWKGGGFHPELGVLVCQNRVLDKYHLEDTVSHELVHVYDNAKFKVDWLNLKHHACSEIRASSLSGECRISNQFWRGAMENFKKGHQDCVKRRAIISVSNHPLCESKQQAKELVNEVWDSCFNDTRPFERIYR